MTIKSVGKTVYNIDNLKIVANVKNLLEYFDDFTRSVTEISLWYLDTDGTTANTNAGSKLDDYWLKLGIMTAQVERNVWGIIRYANFAIFPDFSIYWKSQTSYRNANNHRQIESTPFTMVMFALDGTSFSNCRLEFGNGAYYSKIEYDSDLKVRIFNDLVSYEMQKNDYNTDTQLNLSN